jgi:hypothetical protein
MNMPVKNENDIQILHPKKWVVILFTMLPIIGIGISYAIDSYAWPYFIEWLNHQNLLDPSGQPRRLAITIVTIFVFISINAIIISLYLWIMAAQIIKNKYFPPRGLPILVKTQVIKGRTALKEGYKLFVYGWVVILITAFCIGSVISIFPDITNYVRLLYG